MSGGVQLAAMAERNGGWAIGQGATVVDPSSRWWGRTGSITGFTNSGAISLRFDSRTYSTFDPSQLRPADERQGDMNR